VGNVQKNAKPFRVLFTRVYSSILLPYFHSQADL